jgi:hypothetical protein
MRMIEVVTQKRYLPLDGTCSKYKPCRLYLEDPAEAEQEDARHSPPLHTSPTINSHCRDRDRTLEQMRWDGWWKATREQNVRLEAIERRQHDILEHVKSIRRDGAGGSSIQISPPRQYVPHEPWPETFEEYCTKNCNGPQPPCDDKV